MKTPIITELDWYHYQQCRNLPANFRFGFNVPSVAILPEVLLHRLFRQWWAQTYFEQRVGQSIRSFINQKLNKNSTEVQRKTARRGAHSTGPASDHDWKPTGPERHQSLAELFGRHRYEWMDKAGEVVMEYSNLTFNRVYAMFESISSDDHSLAIAYTAQLRTIDTRKIANLCAYGEPLCDKDDVMSLVGAIILYLPEHARTLLCDDFLPDFQSTCAIRRRDGSLATPIQLEYLRPVGIH